MSDNSEYTDVNVQLASSIKKKTERHGYKMGVVKLGKNGTKPGDEGVYRVN